MDKWDFLEATEEYLLKLRKYLQKHDNTNAYRVAVTLASYALAVARRIEAEEVMGEYGDLDGKRPD